MRLRQTLILSLTAAVVLVLLAPGSWARADESATQSGIESYCSADATCYCYPYAISCEGDSICEAQDDPDGYVECDGQRTDCADVPAVSVSLRATDCQTIGDKSIYTLRATASGGCGGYYFIWYGANGISGPTANPNYATRVILSNPGTVEVNVTSGSQSDSDSVTLRPPCF